jgi:hypothetical protein
MLMPISEPAGLGVADGFGVFDLPGDRGVALFGGGVGSFLGFAG